MESGRPRAGSAALSRDPQADSRDAATADYWTSFLQCYDSLLARELAQERPQFVHALRQLERDSRLQQERQSAQVLATLRLKDTRISELQRLVSEQQEQLDVVLDELERRETKEDKHVQVDACTAQGDAAVQTEAVERTVVDAEVQTEDVERDSGVLSLLQKLEKELQAVEQRNVALEQTLRLQQRDVTRVVEKEEKEEKTEEDERMEECLQTLQRGVEAMDVSCGCVDNPLAFFVGVPRENDEKENGKGGFGGNLSACVNLEHRLEAQAVQLEHLRDCLYLWRDAAVQMMKQRHGCEEGSRSVASSLLQPVIVRHGDGEGVAVNCSVALRGALKQIRGRCSKHCDKRYGDEQRVLRELAQVLAKGKSGAKVAAKIVRTWAGWEASHLEEVRALRQGISEERAVAVTRRVVLLKRIDQLEQQELDLQAELNALRKYRKDHGTRSLTSSESCGEKLFGADSCERPLKYPQLLLRLATAEQSLLIKDEQLKAANGTIRALTSCTPMPSGSSNVAYNGGGMDPGSIEVQRSLQQKLEFFRKREKEMVNLGQYFRLEKRCLQLKSRLEVEQKHTATLQAVQQVCERERDELFMKVEKLESEALVANITCGTAESLPPPVGRNFSLDTGSNDLQSDAYFLVRRLRLLEDDNKNLRDRLRQSQLQKALVMKQQRPNSGPDTLVTQRRETAIFDMIGDHHRRCVSDFKKFRSVQSGATNEEGIAREGEEVVDGSFSEWVVLLSHYAALWSAFYALFLYCGKHCDVSNVQPSNCQNDVKSMSAGGIQEETLVLELSRREEKILLLQQRLMEQEGRLCGGSTDCWQIGKHFDTKANLDNCCGQQLESEYPNINSKEYDFSNRGIKYLAVVMPDETRNSDIKVLSEAERPFLALMKPPESASNRPTNVIALVQTPGTEDGARQMEGQKHTDTPAIDLESCLAKCAELTSQNTKLTRRLRDEKEAKKKYLNEAQELQKELNAKTDANSNFEYAVKQIQNQAIGQSSMLESSIAGENMGAFLESSNHEENVSAVAGISEKDTPFPNRTSEQEYDTLREQLSSREQENLALVQSLCKIKEKCAHMEAIYQKELRVKAAEHAEAMENYMTTVNETLSRIESDKHRLENENVKLGEKLQQLDEEIRRQELERSQRSSKGTSTEGETLELAAYTREKESLKARVVDLELQLARERKLMEMVEQKQQLENQHEELHESAAKVEVEKARQKYEVHCEALKQWRNKLQHEFTEYQTVERASQQESDRRIGFLSDCLEEFMRFADSTAPTFGKNIDTNKLYDIVMDLAKDPSRVASRSIASSSQVKERLSKPRGQKFGNRDQQSVTTSRNTSSNDAFVKEAKGQDEPETSEVMWWKLRASKMEAYVRSAMLQNDTFEDTIRQLESGMSRVKEELTSRLAREAQLMAKLGALKSELATTKEQAASLSEKYRLAKVELEKRQGEATSRVDETQRARMVIQRKTELLAQQKAKVESLQHELEQATKKVERLGTAEKQTALLQQKAKEHTQQLLHARQSYERYHDDNVQLSFHLEKLKERHATVVARLKAARAENAQLRTPSSDLKNNSKAPTPQGNIDIGGKDVQRGNQVEEAAVLIASLTEEARTLKRRVLQKQDVIVSYKSKVANYEAQLERQRETMVKLARTNRELQQGHRQREQQELEYTAALQSKLEHQLEVKREKLDGLRASVYDSLEAFVFCQASATPTSPSSSYTASLDSPLINEPPNENDKLFDIKRWTNFSVDDIEDLRLARGTRLPRTKREREAQHDSKKVNKRKAAAAALRQVEGALEANPEDCRAEICQLLQCLCA